MFKAHLSDIGKNDLLTADANYGHFRILKFILYNGADYCIRMSMCSNFVKDFLEARKKRYSIELVPSSKTKENCQKYGVDI